MKLAKAHIDGFGTIRNADFEFDPRMSVVFGPNEAGKSTLHEFLIGMLYGLKRPDQPHRRVFEGAFDRYRPWHGKRYGGRLEYELADGKRFEVYRRFAKRAEEIRIHALPGGTDRTADFPRLRNGEVEFARTHLGLGKRLFTSAACIRHATVSALAPEEALTAVRDRIAALIDTGREDVSGKLALEVLAEQAKAIGTDRARTKPLARLRRRLETLRAEREAVAAARDGLADLVRRRAALAERIAEVTDHVTEAQRQLDAARRAELNAALTAARRVDERLAELDHEIETLAGYADFPADQHARLIELKREHDLHREDLDRLDGRLADLTADLERLDADLEPLRCAAELPQNALEVATEQAAHLADADHRVALLAQQERELAEQEDDVRTRLAPLENRREQVAGYLDGGEDALGGLWRLEEVVETTRRELHAAQIAGENRHVHTIQIAEQLQQLAPVFDGVTADIEDLRARYEASERAFETIRQEIAPELNRRRAHRFELGATIQQNTAWAWIVLVISAATIGIPLALRAANSNLYILGGAGLFAVAVFFFVRQWAMTRTLRHVEEEVAVHEERLTEQKARVDRHAAVLGRLLEGSPYRTLGEYINAYGTFLRLREAHAEAVANERRAAVEAQQVHDRLQAAHARAQAVLDPVGLELATLEDLPAAVTRFRDGYRRARQVLDDLKDVRRDLDFVEQRRGAVARQRDTAQRERDEVVTALKHLCRQADVDPDAAETLDEAVEAFKSRFRQARLLLSQMEERSARLADLRAQRTEVQGTFETVDRQMAAILETAGVETVEEFRVGLDRHGRLGALTVERERAAERREQILAGRSQRAIKAELKALGPAPAGSAAVPLISPDRADQLRRALGADQVGLAADREELADLAARIDSHLAPFRDLSAVDEDVAAADARLDRLLLMRRAVEVARETIDEVSRRVYASLAPRLNEALGQTIAEVTGGRYREITVDEDLAVWVYVPETGRRLPPSAFSRGAIDQFYLTLRLSVVDLLTPDREPVPLILDDPFTNYDDARLDRAMKVLARRGETNQVLLFTCQRRVRDRAAKAGATVITLKT